MADLYVGKQRWCPKQHNSTNFPYFVRLLVGTVLLVTFLNSSTVRSSPGQTFASSRQLKSRQPAVKLREKDTFCFECKCTCLVSKSPKADCSHNNGTLTFVPRFIISGKYVNIYALDFSHNNLTSIPTDDFFKNVTSMKYFVTLDLRNNDISYVSPGAFRDFQNLRTLILGNNNLMLRNGTSSILPLPQLTSFSLKSTGLTEMPDAFSNLAPHLSELILSNNKLTSLNLSSLSHLVLLLANGCGLYDITFTSARMPDLQVLSLKGNAMFYLPKTCDHEKGESLFPKLRELRLSGTMIESLPGNYCLPSLQVLDLSNTQIFVFTRDMFSVNKFPKLKVLSISNLRGAHRIEKYAFRHPGLEQLDIHNIYHQLKGIGKQALAECPQLRFLDMSYNQIGDTHRTERFSDIFGSPSNLQTLILSTCGIRKMSKSMFANFPRLRTLRLDHNKLTELPDGAFDYLLNLKELSLDFNELGTISRHTFSVETRQRLEKLNLYGNKFVCDCDILWFKGWFMAAPHLFETKFGGYFCENKNNFPLSKLLLREQACYFSQATYKLIIAVITMFLIIFTAVTVVFQFRWQIRLLMYESFRGRSDARYRRLRENHFDFDVFVSYAQDDLPWVLEHLMPQLESKLGLKLCIHQRDFIIGNNIVDNIVDCVESSKKVLMVFSRGFVVSQWCQFELNYCLNHVMEHDDGLIVTCIGDMATMEPTGAMMAVMKTTTYIQWENIPQARAAFWGRIKQAFEEIMGDDVV